MSFTPSELEQRAHALLPALDHAMRTTLEMRASGKLVIIEKPDGSPVTTADEWANTFLTETLNTLFPGEPVVGEETESKVYPDHAELVWFMDPLDGTSHYIKKDCPYHILIGFCLNGEPVFGMCGYPESGKVVYGGNNLPAVNHRLSSHSVSRLPSAPSWTDRAGHRITLKGMNDEQRQAFYAFPGIEKAPFVSDHPSMMGAAFGLADGFLDKRQIARWDQCAPAAIMRSLGYDVGAWPDGTCRMNDGNIRNQGNFYCLPRKSPSEIKDLLFNS